MNPRSLESVLTTYREHGHRHDGEDELAVRVRRYIDMGKVPDMVTPDLESFVPLLQHFILPPA